MIVRDLLTESTEAIWAFTNGVKPFCLIGQQPLVCCNKRPHAADDELPKDPPLFKGDGDTPVFGMNLWRMPDGDARDKGGCVLFHKKGFAPTDRRGAGGYLPHGASAAGRVVGFQPDREVVAFFLNVRKGLRSNLKHK
jgi:hypothetical protein